MPHEASAHDAISDLTRQVVALRSALTDLIGADATHVFHAGTETLDVFQVADPDGEIRGLLTDEPAEHDPDPGVRLAALRHRRDRLERFLEATAQAPRAPDADAAGAPRSSNSALPDA